MRVAALYVERDGVYYGLPGVDPWPEERDARQYDGPWPVVAHPPCARWSRLAGFCEARYGLRRGDDGGCFEAALESVRSFGGVLEHPAYSSAWDAFGLPEPLWRGGWTGGLCGGWSAYVEQGRYGLPVKKATWLYAYGVDLIPLRWGYVPDRDGSGVGGMDHWRDQWGRHAWERACGPKRNRSRTPPEFRDVLLAMAHSAVSAVSEAASARARL